MWWRINCSDLRQSNNFTVALPFHKATVAWIDVDWGDGSPRDCIRCPQLISADKSTLAAKHTYAAGGLYTIRVYRAVKDVHTVCLDALGPEENDRNPWTPYLRRVHSFGSIGVQTIDFLFRSTEHLLCMKRLNTRGIRSMVGLFCASDFNGEINTWDVSTVENMNEMFKSTTSFNQSLGNWDVSRVKKMNGMFAFTKSFNQPIGSWDVSNVETMIGMFEDAVAFNQPLGGWNVSKVWNMINMFDGATKFNQPLDDWKVAKSAYTTNMLLDNVVNPFCDGSTKRRQVMWYLPRWYTDRGLY